MHSAHPSRQAGLDRLKTLLTALVVLHHCAITYGGSGGWFYREVPDGGTPSSLLLSMMCATDQAFFMGLFFLLAAYWSPPSLARKGLRRFVVDRLWRLGAPLVLFVLVLGPLTLALALRGPGEGADEVARHAVRIVAEGGRVMGPLWFAWALLLFTGAWLLVEVVARRVRGDRPRAADGEAGGAARPIPGPCAWAVAVLGCGAVAFALRQWVPTGQERWGVQVGFCASYVGLFALGIAAWRGRWLERLTAAQARPWLVLSLSAWPVLPVTAWWFGAMQGRHVRFDGGPGPAALVYAFWEPAVAVGLIASLLVAARGWPSGGRWWRRWDAAAFPAYVLHAPVLVAVSLALQGWVAPALVKFAAVGTLSVAIAFVLGDAVLRTPGLRLFFGPARAGTAATDAAAPGAGAGPAQAA